jgi:hypothetical protein
LLAITLNLKAQVGISSTSITPDASAMLEVRSTNKCKSSAKSGLKGI